jgi:rhomboid protease GluP
MNVRAAESTDPLAAPANPRVVVGRYPNAQAGFDHGVVLVATGVPCWLESSADGSEHLLVPPADADHARAQLTAFDRESRGWPPRPRAAPEPPYRGPVWFTPLIWVIVTLAAYAAQDRFPAWLDWGALNPTALFAHGEVWRPFTALFLHADLAHVVSNTGFGLIVFRTLLATYRSSRRPWLWLLLASLAGNTATAAMYLGESYQSIGASTAVFAGLGLLTGRAVRRPQLTNRWRSLAVPLAAGLTFLGLYGAGGPQTDVLAHVNGFTAGVLLGWVVSRTAPPTTAKFA